jgi:hypothetical protein
MNTIFEPHPYRHAKNEVNPSTNSNSSSLQERWLFNACRKDKPTDCSKCEGRQYRIKNVTALMLVHPATSPHMDPASWRIPPSHKKTILLLLCTQSKGIYGFIVIKRSITFIMMSWAVMFLEQTFKETQLITHFTSFHCFPAYDFNHLSWLETYGWQAKSKLHSLVTSCSQLQKPSKVTFGFGINPCDNVLVSQGARNTVVPRITRSRTQ